MKFECISVLISYYYMTPRFKFKEFLRVSPALLEIQVNQHSEWGQKFEKINFRIPHRNPFSKFWAIFVCNCFLMDSFKREYFTLSILYNFYRIKKGRVFSLMMAKNFHWLVYKLFIKFWNLKDDILSLSSPLPRLIKKIIKSLKFNDLE